MQYAWASPPPLPPAHRGALAEALSALEARDDLLAVVLAGSVVRGAGGPTSDLDLFCVVSRGSRQRRQIVATTGVLVEVFQNPAHQVRRYLTDERRRNRPSTAHMLTTGHVLLARAPEVLAALTAEAAEVLRGGPDPLEGAERHMRVYGLRDLFEDAVDAAAAPAGGVALALPHAQCLLHAVSLHYALRRRWEPKPKDAASDLARWDPEGARLLSACGAAPALRSLRALCAHVLRDEGGLEIRSWDGPDEPVAPPL